MKRIKDYISFTNKYIKENMLRHIVINSLFFVVVLLLAFIAMFALPKEQVKDIYEYIIEIMQSKDVTTADGTLSFWGIFFNNLRAGFFISAFGFIPGLFLPLFYVCLNAGLVGAILGIIEVMTAESAFLSFIKYILPHGIFEIPALILEGAIGTKLCAFLLRKIFGYAKEEKFRFHIKGFFGIFVVYVVPMLIVAAFIEAVVLELIYL